MNIDFKKLGDIALAVRKQLGLTRIDVQLDTGISIETIRRLEIGMEPKISTLEILTDYYSFDLLSVLSLCRTKNSFFSKETLSGVIDYMRSNDVNEFEQFLSQLYTGLVKESHESKGRDIHYLAGFLQSLKSIKINQTRNIETTIINIEQLLLSISYKSNTNKSNTFLSPFEMTVSIFLAILYRRNNNANKSISLLNSILAKLEQYPLLSCEQLSNIVTVNLNLSYAYHYFDDHDKVLSIIDSVLNNSEFTFTNATYHDLLLRKAHALYMKENSDYLHIYKTILLNETSERYQSIVTTAEKTYGLKL